MSNAQAVLICTVGGSHQPILTSIREVEPHVRTISTRRLVPSPRPSKIWSDDFPGATLVANYTGGTKTMTAALVDPHLHRLHAKRV